jgi:exodeoxyribonuclease V alpha subunit|tara:strand:+ start:187 stop:531 length:345 start_codon:yes stop_codon:yes gene_type:complete
MYLRPSMRDIMYYDNVSEANRLKYANGFVWQVPIRSDFSDQGFSIPYHKYRNQPEISTNFKYGTKHISDDDVLIYAESLTEIITYLISIVDSENWKSRKTWLISLQNELWKIIN